MNLKDKLQLLPNSIGIYKFLDKKGDILYVGKAINLKSRVNSYFSDIIVDRPRIIPMIPQITDIQIIETANEIEALVLESAVIRELKPKYNSDLKDDKSYAYLYINHKDIYPTVKIVRNIKKNEIKNGKMFGPYPSGRAIQSVFKYLRKIYPFCTAKDPTKPCFDSQIGLCPGVVPRDEYMKNINGIIEFLEGKNHNLLSQLESQMNEYSSSLEYEKAASLRDKISDLRYLTSKIETKYIQNQNDYISLKYKQNQNLLKNLSKQLNIDIPKRIECYDISNLLGTNAYGSMTVAIDGQIETSMYRIFKIKGLDTPNDYEMLLEVLQRRLKHINSDVDESLSQKPNIILIDGGVGQLNKLIEIVPKDITLLGITKGRKYKRKGGRLKDEFVIRKDNLVVPIKLRNTNIFLRLRDEAHRYAIMHYRKSKMKSQVKSIFDDIKNVGPKTKSILKKNFNTQQLKTISIKQLNKVIKNKRIANSILQYFQKQVSN